MYKFNLLQFYQKVYHKYLNKQIYLCFSVIFLGKSIVFIGNFYNGFYCFLSKTYFLKKSKIFLKTIKKPPLTGDFFIIFIITHFFAVELKKEF